LNLLGRWVVDESDAQAGADFGDVILEFNEDGQLIYIVRGESRDQVMDLRYKIDGDTLVTDQPSAPKTERTKFSISQDGVLTLEFGGIPYHFRRQTMPAP